MHQAQKAQAFRRMHFTNTPLLLPNAWDALSARLFEAAGFEAIATTSAGVAWSLGYQDGEQMPRGLMIETIGRIVRTVDVPVTADIEAGYGRTPSELAATVMAVIQAGAVGINLEDSVHDGAAPRLRHEQAMVERLQAARAAANAAGVPIVINARTDQFLYGSGSVEQRFSDTLQRAQAYLAAGADCIFPIKLTDGALLADLVHALKAPVNVVSKPETPALPELARIGVARVSTAIAPVLAMTHALQQLAASLHQSGSYAAMASPLMHPDVQGLFRPI